MLTLVGLIVVLLLLLQNSNVQTWLTGKVADYLSEELNTTISLSRIDFEFLHTLVLEDVYMADQKGDTLGYVHRLELDGIAFNKESGQVDLGTIHLYDPCFALRANELDSSLNLQFIIDYFSPEVPDTTESAPFFMTVENLTIHNGKFIFDDPHLGTFPGLMQYGDLSIDRINVNLNDLELLGDSLHVNIAQAEGRDKCGMELHSLSGAASMSNNIILLQDAHLSTAEAELNGQIAFKYSTIGDFLEFNTKVKMDHDLVNSKLNMKELRYFANELGFINKEIFIDGRISGRVSNLRSKDIFIKLDENTWFKGDFRMDGLPDFENTFITLNVNELVSNKKELERIPAPPFEKGDFIQTPEAFSRLGQMRFEGNYTGFINDFTAFGTLQTAIGSVTSDITLSEDDDTYSYKGKLNMDHFDLGRFVLNDAMGPITAQLKVEGSGLNLDDLKANIDGRINDIELNDYRYQNIKIKGVFADKFFNGDLKISDENLFADFSGKVDLSKKNPTFSFDADIANIDLVDLHFYDVAYSSLSLYISADATGNSLQTLEGSVKLSEIEYCSMDQECRVEEISLTAHKIPEGQEITVESSLVDGRIAGEFKFETLSLTMMEILSELIPSIENEGKDNPHAEKFVMSAKIHDFSIINEFFIPELDVSDGTTLNMSIDDKANKFTAIIVSDAISYTDFRMEGLTVDARRQDSAIYFTTLSDYFFVNDSLSFNNFALDGRTEQDTIYTALSWENELDGHRGDINTQLTVRGNENFDLVFNSAAVTLQDQQWVFDPNARVQIDSTRFQFYDFNIVNDLQRIGVSGIIVEHPKPWLNVELHAFEMSNFNPFLKGTGLQLQGSVTGEANLRDAYNKKLLSADLIGLNFVVNGYEIGDICLESTYDVVNNRMMMAGELSRLDKNEVSFGGWYSPSDEVSPLNMNLQLNHLNLAFINSFVSEGISDITGTLSGNIELTGRPEAPELNGGMDFEDVSVHVDYLNTTYFIKESAGVYPDMITLDNIRIRDEKGNTGYVIGTILHENFEAWNFDVYLDIEEEQFLCLNTTEYQNDLYYGQAYAQGYVNIFGYLDNLEIDVSAEVGRGTNLSLPLSGSEDVTFEDFIVFFDPNATPEQEKVDLTGISMNLELDVLPEADFKLIFDEAVGDVMAGRAQGHLSMEITPVGDFHMYGLMEIVQGSYLFTLKNLINKEFTVKPGGTIAWYGDPLSADINLETAYELTTTLQTILGGTTGQYTSRVPVELIMNLDGKLMNPGITFDINVPSADEITKSRLSAAISTEEERNRQAFALLVLRSFVSPPNVASNSTKYTGGAVAENSSELISSQLSNWLSQISSDFDIGFNYRPGDDISNEEIAVALSTQLFNERLLLSGNFGVSNGNEANQNSSGLIGDLQVEYKITVDGKIRLVVYNESNDFQTLSTSDAAYNQGVGFLYKEEFNSMDEFYCGFKNLFRKEENQIDCD